MLFGLLQGSKASRSVLAARQLAVSSREASAELGANGGSPRSENIFVPHLIGTPTNENPDELPPRPLVTLVSFSQLFIYLLENATPYGNQRVCYDCPGAIAVGEQLALPSASLLLGVVIGIAA